MAKAWTAGGLLGLMALLGCGGTKVCPEGSAIVGSSCQPIDASAADAGVDAPLDAATDAAVDAEASCDATCPDDGNECTRCDEACTLVPLTNVLCAEGDGVCWSGDCQPVHVLYQVGSSSGIEVYVVPIDGSGEPRLLSPPLPAGRTLESWWLSKDRSRFVYLADQDTPHVHELYAVPIDGSGEALKLNVSLEAGDDVSSIVQFHGDRVLYKTRNSDLYSVAIDGSGGRKVNDAPVESFKVTASGRVIYTSADGSARDLFLTNLAGMTPRRVNVPLPSGARVRDFQVGLDETALYYLADQDTVGVPELYRFDFTGGAVTKVNPPLVPGGSVHAFQALDAGRVVYLSDQTTAGIRELFLADAAGDVTRLNGPLVADGQVSDFFPQLLFAADGTTLSAGDYVLYAADQDTPGLRELFAARLDGGGVVKLSGTLPPGGELSNYGFFPGSERALYRATQDTPGVFELYSVRLDGSERVKVNDRLVPGGQVLGLVPTFDGQWVIYMADQDIDEVVEVYAARVDGSERVKLNGPLVAGGDVYDALLANLQARSAWAVYLADQDVDEVIEVYASRYDGTRRLKLNAPLRVGQQVEFAGQLPLPL